MAGDFAGTFDSFPAVSPRGLLSSCFSRTDGCRVCFGTLPRAFAGLDWTLGGGMDFDVTGFLAAATGCEESAGVFAAVGGAFVAGGGAFDEVACGVDGFACIFDDSACGFDNATCGFDNATCGFDNAACGFDNAACGSGDAAGGFGDSTWGPEGAAWRPFAAATGAFAAGTGMSVLAAENQLRPGQLQTPISSNNDMISSSQRFAFFLRRIANSPSNSISIAAHDVAGSGIVTRDSFSAHGLIYLLSVMSPIS